MIYVFVLSSSINGLCHHVGYKNFDNTATNIRFLALLTGGEGLHNNHHGYPRSPKFSFKASEIDPAWPIIKLLIALRPREAVTRRSTKSRPESSQVCGGLKRRPRRRRRRRRSNGGDATPARSFAPPSSAGAASAGPDFRQHALSSARPFPARRRESPARSARRGRCGDGQARAARAGWLTDPAAAAAG